MFADIYIILDKESAAKFDNKYLDRIGHEISKTFIAQGN